jgi:hypothetical protein
MEYMESVVAMELFMLLMVHVVWQMNDNVV